MAEIVQLSDYVSEIIADLPGCTTIQALKGLRKALRDFQDETEIWTEDLDPIDIVKDQVQYTLTPSYDASVHRILEVKIDGSVIAPDKYELILDDDTIEFILELSEDITPVAAITDGLEVKVVLRSFIKTDDIPEYFFDRWGEAVILKAKSDLMLSPKKPYTNPQMGMKYLNDYKDRCAKAQREKIQKNKQTELQYNNPLLRKIF